MQYTSKVSSNIELKITINYIIFCFVTENSKICKRYTGSHGHTPTYRRAYRVYTLKKNWKRKYNEYLRSYTLNTPLGIIIGTSESNLKLVHT